MDELILDPIEFVRGRFDEFVGYSEIFDIGKVRAEPELFREFTRLMIELQTFPKPAPVAVVNDLAEKLIGIFDQADWYSRGFRDLAVNQHGRVIAVRVIPKLEPLSALIEFWVSIANDFQPPDGGLVLSIADVEKLWRADSTEEAKKFRLSKIH